MGSEGGDQTRGADEPGAQLGAFRLGRRLGAGGMGIVYQALDTSLNRQVALKVISPQIGDDPDFQARFRREAQAQASLDSPHVVQVYSFGEADGRLYIASQLIPDGDLGQMLAKHGRPPARIAVNLMSQVADGLADAHAAGLVHRDIKPANVLLRNRDQQLFAYLGDFGIARQVGQSQLTQAGGTVGTPSYMAPELHTGGDSGTSSDIYSLGCLLWAALSGKAPYAGGTQYQVVMAHMEQPVPQLAPTGPLALEINRVLATAMAKNPAQRYPTAAAMRDDLKRVVRMPDDQVPVHPAEGAAPVSDQWSFPPPVHTPTPTPTPGQAPPAPTFVPPAPPQASFQHSHYEGPTPPQRGGRLGWVIAVLLVLVLGGGAALAAVLINRGDDDPRTTTTTTDPTPTDDPTSEDPDPTEDPTQATPQYDFDAREQQAADALVDNFLTQAGATEESSRCLADELVNSVGVDKLIGAGLLTRDLEYNEDSSTPNPDFDVADSLEVLQALTDVTDTCTDRVGGSVPSPSTG
ncbi:serine/threonine-protein kinase [Nocardioides litoris]|uniref:serine/threonine-protein kinase n=1 Tax=Nocardioides litoris TaxID=1926648 RepID=UPI00111CFFE8|nr:serine/threonine-protein kinase [Nocardioides litoris]